MTNEFLKHPFQFPIPPVEFPAADAGVEAGSGPGYGEHCSNEASRADTAVGAVPGPAGQGGEENSAM